MYIYYIQLYCEENFCESGDNHSVRDDVQGGTQRAHQEAHERIHGMVKGSAAENGTGESKDAQLRDIKEAWRRVEAA